MGGMGGHGVSGVVIYSLMALRTMCILWRDGWGLEGKLGRVVLWLRGYGVTVFMFDTYLLMSHGLSLLCLDVRLT